MSRATEFLKSRGLLNESSGDAISKIMNILKSYGFNKFEEEGPHDDFNKIMTYRLDMEKPKHDFSKGAMSTPDEVKWGEEHDKKVKKIISDIKKSGFKQPKGSWRAFRSGEGLWLDPILVKLNDKYNPSFIMIMDLNTDSGFRKSLMES
jgi:hypothetical protein